MVDLIKEKFINTFSSELSDKEFINNILEIENLITSSSFKLEDVIDVSSDIIYTKGKLLEQIKILLNNKNTINSYSLSICIFILLRYFPLNFFSNYDGEIELLDIFIQNNNENAHLIYDYCKNLYFADHSYQFLSFSILLNRDDNDFIVNTIKSISRIEYEFYKINDFISFISFLYPLRHLSYPREILNKCLKIMQDKEDYLLHEIKEYSYNYIDYYDKLFEILSSKLNKECSFKKINKYLLNLIL